MIVIQLRNLFLISTDKAVNQQILWEHLSVFVKWLFQTYDKLSKTEYVAVRFGNVLGSNGSSYSAF